MNYIQKRIADRKLTCARCQAVWRAFRNLEECREIVARMSRPEADEFDKPRLPDWAESLKNSEAELVGETRPETCAIKRNEECMYVALSGAHYLHLARTEKYIEDVKKVLEAHGT